MAESLPRFSVVITAYNCRAYIGQAVDSALAQQYAAHQIIVVDDGSSDGSGDWLAERYCDQSAVQLIRQANAGQIAAAQRGLQACTGDICCFLDGDDWWEPNYLSTLREVYARDPDMNYVCANMRLHGKHQRLFHELPTDYDLGVTTLVTYKLHEGMSLPTSAISLPRAWAERALRLPPALVEEWRIGLDNCLACGAGLFGARKYFLAAPLVNYRLHEGNQYFEKRRARPRAHQEEQRYRRLLNHYIREASISEDWTNRICQEFQTRPSPSREDTRRYLRITWSSSQPLLTKLRYSLSILRHYRNPARAVQTWPRQTA